MGTEPAPVLLAFMLQLKEQLGIPGLISSVAKMGEAVEVESWYFSV